MQVGIGDRLVLHGRHGTRIGVVVEQEEGGVRLRWADGGESVLSAGSEGSEQHGRATWEAAKAGPAVTWRRGVTAGVGREASLRLDELTAKEVAEAGTVEATVAAEAEAEAEVTVEAEHKPAAGE